VKRRVPLLDRLNIPAPIIGGLVFALAALALRDRYVNIDADPGLRDLLQIAFMTTIGLSARWRLLRWELAHLALPILVILIAQVALCWFMCVALSFRVMGRDYEAAVATAGFCGFMLGITTNAVACMEELVEKYGPAPKAFLVVPVVGAFLIDFTNSLIITATANLVR